MTNTKGFGADALELNTQLYTQIDKLTTFAIKNYVANVDQRIKNMQIQHKKALAKAAGEWIDCKDELPLDSGDFLTQTVEGEMEKEYFSYLDRRFAVNLQPVRWLKAAPVPAPPPLPEKEIEVPDLVEESCGGWGDDYVNEAHKAAMLPVLKENAALKARLKEVGS